MKRRLLLTLLVFIVFWIFLWFGSAVFNPISYEEIPATTALDFSQPTQPPINSEASTIPDLKQTAWIPDWDFTNGFNSLKATAQFFDSVSPVWYQVNTEGLIISNRKGLEELKAFAETNAIALIPSIANFSADDMHLILSDETRLQAHIDYLKSEVTAYDYDGLDLDYESIYLEDKLAFLSLVKELYSFLDEQGKTLTIAVMPIWTDSDCLFSLRQTRQVQDWSEIGQYVHQLRIMSYNLTNYNAIYAGAVSPLDWQQAILRYADTRVDSSKVYLGIGLYGYAGWSNNPNIPDPYLGLTANGISDAGQADAVTYDDLMRIWGPYQVSNNIDDGSKEKLLVYYYKGKNYFVFYTDREVAEFRYNLAKEYNIAGVAHWRLGGEDESIFSLVDE